jgi:NAD(P)-dependent dehydrogenase (short-subunit alcohol dehydrogenase family)
MSTWFITGCSTGLGRALAEAVLERGENAVITARDAGRLEDLAKAYRCWTRSAPRWRSGGNLARAPASKTNPGRPARACGERPKQAVVATAR